MALLYSYENSDSVVLSFFFFLHLKWNSKPCFFSFVSKLQQEVEFWIFNLNLLTDRYRQKQLQMEWHSEQSATFSSWSRAGISWAGIKGLRLNWELWFKLFLAENYFSAICLTCPVKVTWICRWWIAVFQKTVSRWGTLDLLLTDNLFICTLLQLEDWRISSIVLETLGCSTHACTLP